MNLHEGNPRLFCVDIPRWPLSSIAKKKLMSSLQIYNGCLVARGAEKTMGVKRIDRRFWNPNTRLVGKP